MDIVERMKAMLDAGDAVGGISRVFVPAHDVRDLLAEIERLRSLSDEPVRDEIIEMCARVADQWVHVCTKEAAGEPGDPHGHEADANMAKTVASSIRSLKQSPVTEPSP